jgi:hypothetical protein
MPHCVLLCNGAAKRQETRLLPQNAPPLSPVLPTCCLRHALTPRQQLLPLPFKLRPQPGQLLLPNARQLRCCLKPLQGRMPQLLLPPRRTLLLQEGLDLDPDAVAPARSTHTHTHTNTQAAPWSLQHHHDCSTTHSRNLSCCMS